MNQTPSDPRKVKPQLVLFLLILVFLGPMLFAWGVYKRSDNLSFSYMNQGDLILPPVPVDTMQLEELKAQALYPTQKLTGKWSIAYLLPDYCQTYCQENLYNVKQVHTALGKDANRVQRMIWTLQHQKNASQIFLEDTYPDVPQVQVSQSAFEQYLDPLVDKAERIELGAFYVIDPHGNIILSYAGDMPAKSIMKDLKRLLKVSHIG